MVSVACRFSLTYCTSKSLSIGLAVGQEDICKNPVVRPTGKGLTGSPEVERQKTLPKVNTLGGAFRVTKRREKRNGTGHVKDRGRSWNVGAESIYFRTRVRALSALSGKMSNVEMEADCSFAEVSS